MERERKGGGGDASGNGDGDEARGGTERKGKSRRALRDKRRDQFLLSGGLVEGGSDDPGGAAGSVSTWDSGDAIETDEV